MCLWRTKEKIDDDNPIVEILNGMESRTPLYTADRIPSYIICRNCKSENRSTLCAVCGHNNIVEKYKLACNPIY